MRRRSKKITSQRKNIVRGFLFLNAILWLIYCGYIYYDMAVVNSNKTSADIAAIFLFVMAGLMFVSGLMLGKVKIEGYYFALIVVSLNTLLMLFNLPDLFFLISFLLDLVILWLLIPLRKDYLLKS